MDSPPEPHFHSRIKCGEIRVADDLKAVYGKPTRIRRAFCVKHQVIICWAKDECGWEIRWHWESKSVPYQS